jgi:hypothetical protein
MLDLRGALAVLDLRYADHGRVCSDLVYPGRSGGGSGVFVLQCFGYPGH